MITTLIAKTGINYFTTIERLSDGLFRSNISGEFASSLSFNDKKVSLVEGINENLGSFRSVINSSSWIDGLYYVRIHGEDNQTLAGEMVAFKDGEEVAVGEQSGVFDVYHADIQFTKSNAADLYTVTWFKNGERVSNTISSSTISARKRDNTYLFQNLVPTQLSGAGSYKLDVSDSSKRQIKGIGYVVETSAVIDGNSRFFSWILSRDEI